MLTMSPIIMSVISLMTDYYPDNPVNGDAARMYLKDRKEFEETASFWTEAFACDNEAWEKLNEE